ncbi:hypothetical protein IM774_05520 [Erysipelotrichaceae bacterium RD49]|nr:hypothetical protein [Erysipelotrichaceae bacterium RD49]
MNFKMQYRLLVFLYVGLVIFSITIGFQIDIVQENLTGLGWKNHQFWQMAFYCLLACGYDGYLTWFVLKNYNEDKPAQLSCLCWALMVFGALIPWNAPQFETRLDLHTLVCTSAIGANGVLWLWIYTHALSEIRLRQIAGSILSCLIFSLLLFGISGCVSYLCEAFYILSTGLICLVSLKKTG